MNTEETTFDKIRNRPRFKMYTDLEPKEFENSLRDYLENNKNFIGNINREIATIWVKTESEPMWKPNLALRTEKEDEKTAIRGIFGPSSNMWTFVMFLYFLFSILWMVFFTLWFVGKQINTEEYAWCLPVSFGMIGLIIATYIAVRIGQKKTESEMNQLRDFVIQSTLKHEKITPQQQ